MDKLTTPASYFASGTIATSGTIAIFGGMTINEWMAIVGIILGIATFALNWFYKHKQFKQMRETRKDRK